VPANRHGRWLLTYQTTSFAGLQVILTAVLTEGALIVARSRTPAALVEAAQRHGATHVSGTPTFWRSFLCVAAPSSLPTLRQITLGGEAVDQTTLDRLARAFPEARLTHIYASTEGGVGFAVCDGREGFPADWVRRRGDDLALRIREGVLEMKTPRRMLHYVSDAPELFTEDGWLRTGDQVDVYGDRVRFLGRCDDVINVGGAKVHPHVVEACLLGLEGVREARVRGVASPVTGAIVSAEVVLGEGIDVVAARQSILTLCHRRLLAHEVPRVLKIVKEIAVLESGKKG
jgi:acyl-coenzyme A synthetase/AMP-(fatty) acid ligase